MVILIYMINTKIMALVLSGVFVGIFSAATIPPFIMASNAKKNEVAIAINAEVLLSQAENASQLIRIQTNRDETEQTAKIAMDKLAVIKSDVLNIESQINKSSALINLKISDSQAQSELKAAETVLNQAQANLSTKTMARDDAQQALTDALAAQATTQAQSPTRESVETLKNRKKAAQEAAKAQWVRVDINKKNWALRIVAARDDCKQHPEDYNYWFDRLKIVEAEALASNKADRKVADALEDALTQVDVALKNLSKLTDKNIKNAAKESLKNKSAIQKNTVQLQETESELAKANQSANEAALHKDAKEVDMKERGVLANSKVQFATAIQNKQRAEIAFTQTTQEATLAATEAAGISKEALLKAPGLISQAREIQKELDVARLEAVKTSMTASASMKWGVVGAVAADIFVALGLMFWRKAVGMA